MAKHAASKTVRRFEPPPARLAGEVAGRHRAPATGRHRAPVDLRGKAPANAAISAGGTRASQKAQTRPSTRYVGKNALYTPRSSRTRYIRYLGNNDVTNTPKLVAEWLGGVVLICIAVPTQAANVGYAKTITRIMYRLTALTAVFFVLALMANSKAGKVAVYAGLLIDLGIVFDAVQSGTLKGTANIMTGKPILQSGTEPAADVVKPVDNPIGGGLIQGLNLTTTGGTISNAPVPA